MRLTQKQLDRIEGLRLEWGLADQQVCQHVTGWATMSARAGIERAFYRRINDVCDPDHELSIEDAVVAGQMWWKDIQREAFLNLREESRA